MSIWGHPFMVRVIFPGRKGKAGKRDLVKGMPSHGAAVIYAKRVADRGRKTALMGNADANPIACVYDVKQWGASPECYAARHAESKTSPGYLNRRSDIRVRRVPWTSFDGLRRRRKRRR